MKKLNGVIVIDKPSEITSFEVVRKIRSLTSCKKVGHTGTLDPLATGVLPVCIGKATKAVNYLIKDNKEYIAEIKLGEVTDTYDREGEFLSKMPVAFSKEEVTGIVNSFIGNIKQKPPKFSALKIKGKKMYELARAGIEFEIPEREVTIFNIDIIDIKIPFIKIQVKCSKGTYIRSLANDIGEKLGCGAHLYNLRRISSGIFKIKDSIKLEDVTQENLEYKIISIEHLFSNLDNVNLDSRFYKLFVNGVCIKDKVLVLKIKEAGLYKVYDPMKQFIGIGKREKDYFKMESLF